ncbi:MAG: potassium channel family protein [Geminicoccaceae bacterium]|nr:potassium channel family protein [Geminicoccaceae bacterium]
MGSLFAAGGVVLIALTMIDVFWTTITARGAGSITARLTQSLHRGLRRLAELAHLERLLAVGGPLILCLTFTVWVSLLWAGWWLLVQSDPQAVVSSATGLPGGPIDRLYFVGFTLSTLGIGDFKPGSGLWRVLTALMALNGLVVITLAITYILSVLSAVIAARQTAGQISALGRSPEEILIRGFDGQSFGPLETWLGTLMPSVLALAQNQLAFPIMHTFRSMTADAASPARAALLAEAVLLLRAGVAPEARPSPGLTAPVDDALDQLLRTMLPNLQVHPETPPAPDLRTLARDGVSVVNQEDWRATLAAERQRRQQLHALVRLDGWTWSEIVRG